MRIFIRSIVKIIDKLRLNLLSKSIINLLSRQDYAHGLSWFGARIFQTPTDLFLYQQIIFRAKPQIIIETGVAKGGSVLFACQMLELLHKQDQASYWKVICCDINPVDEAQVLIHQNGFSDRVLFFQGDSASTEFKVLVENAIQDKSESSILLSLDSNHTEEHVFSELISLAGFVTTSSYAIVWDSRIGDLSFLTHYLRPRAWSKRKHAGTGARLFMASIHGQEFTYERSFEQDLLLTGTKYGILLKQ